MWISVAQKPNFGLSIITWSFKHLVIACNILTPVFAKRWPLAWYALAPLFLLLSDAYADYTKVDCLGSEKAANGFVYLHGWDDPSLGYHEKVNRKILARIAAKTDSKIALARGHGRCSKGQKQCWQMTTPFLVEKEWAEIKKAALMCGLKKDWGIVGFSSGGYMVSSLFNLCLKPPALWLISFGAAENRRFKVSQAKCSQLTLIIGDKDGVREKTLSYYKKLKKLGTQVTYKEFKGGHVIHEKSLLEALEKLQEKKGF